MDVLLLVLLGIAGGCLIGAIVVLWWVTTIEIGPYRWRSSRRRMAPEKDPA